MYKLISLALSLACLMLTACASHMYVTPFEGELPLRYSEAQGKLSMETSIPFGRMSLPTALCDLEYSVEAQGETLVWKIGVEGQYLGFKGQKRVVPLTVSEVFGLYPLEPSHPKLSLTVVTDPFGNILSVDDYKNAETGQPLPDDYWKTYYSTFFSSLFPAFDTPTAQMGAVVSTRNILLSPERVERFPPAEVRVVGKSFMGDGGIKLEYENVSMLYKNAVRDKCIDRVEVYSILDEKTNIVHQARVLYYLKDAHFVTVVNESKK